MPKRLRRNSSWARVDIHSDNEIESIINSEQEDVEYTQAAAPTQATQATTTTNPRLSKHTPFTKLPEAEQDAVLYNAVRFLLTKNHLRAEPVRFEDLRRAIIGQNSGVQIGKQTKEVLNRLNILLVETLGMKLVRVQKVSTVNQSQFASASFVVTQTQAQGTTAGASPGGIEHSAYQKSAFLLVNALPKSVRPPPPSPQIYGLIAVIAACIMLDEKQAISQNELYTHLHRLGITEQNREDHPTLGNVKQLIESDFVKQYYFVKHEVGQKDTASEDYLYTLGDRLFAEVSVEDLVAFAEDRFAADGGFHATYKSNLIKSLQAQAQNVLDCSTAQA